MSEPANPFEEWMLVEQLGHKRIAGLVTEQTIAGFDYLRIDIPEVPAEPEVHYAQEWDGGRRKEPVEVQPGPSHECIYHCRTARPGIAATTQLITPSSVYTMHPITEELARRMAVDLRIQPINRLDFPQLMSPLPREALPFGDEE